jgi:hypothetical protein
MNYLQRTLRSSADYTGHTPHGAATAMNPSARIQVRKAWFSDGRE